MTLRSLHDVPAPAKLNLFLHVIGRREDGYHLLQSLFVLVDWADHLHFELRDDGRLQRHDIGPALPPDDLCLRAARALAGASGTTLGADIHIDKRLPTGAGMGGGSSDAATTLLALNRLWGLHWPRGRLAAIGFGLGADVPFFVRGRNAFVEGIGERITPVTVPLWTYAVVKPAASLQTASIFDHPALLRDTEPVIIAGYSGNWDWAAEGFGRNDLQPPAQDRCPEVAEVARWLESRFGNSRMTGSGSAVFARVKSRLGTSATPEAMPVPTDPPESLAVVPAGWVGQMCRGLAQHPLLDWAGE